MFTRCLAVLCTLALLTAVFGGCTPVTSPTPQGALTGETTDSSPSAGTTITSTTDSDTITTADGVITTLPDENTTGGETGTTTNSTDVNGSTTADPNMSGNTTTSGGTTTTGNGTTTTGNGTTTTGNGTTTTVGGNTTTTTGGGATTPTTAPSGGADQTPVTPSGIIPGSPEAGTSFSTLNRAPAIEESTTRIGRFLFTTQDNPSLPFNVACYVTNTHITALLPANADLSALKPNFIYDGTVMYNGAVLTSRSTAMDLRNDVTLTLKGNNGTQKTVTVHIEKIATDLPSMSISTSGYAAVDSKVDYKAASFSVGNATSTVKGADLSIKGRGNTSWTYDKKCYTLRFETKYALLGLRESKNYVLLAAHADRSLMRYQVGEYLARAMGMESVMGSAYVDLWLNGIYQGVYMLVEKIEVEPSRVDITDYVVGGLPNTMGYLLEFDTHLFNNATPAERNKWVSMGTGETKAFYDPTNNEVFFRCDVFGEHWLTIRTTNAKNLTQSHVAYISLVVNTAATALKNGDWDTVQKWVDVQSFVDWYLIMEYLNNTDTAMESSVYMYIDAGGKLTLGPIWDLDNCAGNHNETVSTSAHPLFDNTSGWFYYLFKIPAAKSMLKSRWNTMKTAINGVSTFIDNKAATLSKAAALNFSRWNILGTALAGQPSSIAAANTYQKQVDYLKKYLADRYTALNSFYSNL